METRLPQEYENAGAGGREGSWWLLVLGRGRGLRDEKKARERLEKKENGRGACLSKETHCNVLRCSSWGRFPDFFPFSFLKVCPYDQPVFRVFTFYFESSLFSIILVFRSYSFDFSPLVSARSITLLTKWM